MPTLGGWMWFGGFPCALQAQGGQYIFWDYISCTYNLGDINYLNIIAGIGYKEPTMGGGDIYLLGLYVSCTCLADKHI